MLVDVRCCWVMRCVPDLYRDADPWLDEGHARCAEGWGCGFARVETGIRGLIVATLCINGDEESLVSGR